MHGRVRVHRTDQDLELGERALGFFLAAGDERESSGTFPIKPHVLGVALRQPDLMAVLDEKANGEGIAVNGTAGEALVSHVEEREEILLLDERRQFLPLLRRRVNARWVVCARMK